MKKQKGAFRKILNLNGKRYDYSGTWWYDLPLLERDFSRPSEGEVMIDSLSVDGEEVDASDLDDNVLTHLKREM